MPAEVHTILAVASFALGACISSFLNVVIWRVPRGESIVLPPSHCPKCNALIRWYQNLPILSWLCLRGKCAKCHAPISPRYILVETLGGLLFLMAFLAFDVWAPVHWVWISLMIVGTFIDFDHQLLPDFVTIGGMIFGLVVSLALWGFPLAGVLLPPLPDYPLAGFPSPLWSLVGGAFGFALLWLVRFFGSKAFGREAMGMGDVLLLGAVGAMFGPVAVLFTLIVSSVLGALAGVGLMLAAKIRLGRFVAIPFGPYLAAASLIWLFRGPLLVEAYLRLLKP